MESVLIKYKVRENQKSKVEDWVEYFKNNKAKNLQTAIEIFKSSENPHDIYHKKFMNESLGFVQNLSNLIDIDTLK